MKQNGVNSKTIILGLRPDSLTLAESDECPAAHVGVVEMMGTTVHLHLEFNGKDIILVTQAKDENQHLKMNYESDSKVHFSFPPQSMYLFDIETGKNLAI